MRVFYLKENLLQCVIHDLEGETSPHFEASFHSLLRISVVVVVVVVGVVVVEVGLIGTRGLFRLPEPSAPEAERGFNLPKVCSHTDSALSQCVRYDTHINAVTTMSILHVCALYNLSTLVYKYLLHCFSNSQISIEQQRIRPLLNVAVLVLVRVCVLVKLRCTVQCSLHVCSKSVHTVQY